MFTGIIEEVGHVESILKRAEGMEIGISAPKLFPGLNLGDSLAVNGACLTITRKVPPHTLIFDISPETLSRTRIGKLQHGDLVNLEPALTLNKPLGGHLVSGHVDGQAVVTAIRRVGDMVEMTFEVQSSRAEEMIEKGSVALDGISLTIASLRQNTFTVALIPHTLKQTTLGNKRVGDTLNLETDLIGKYVKRFISTPGGRERNSISEAFLAEHGFLK